MSRYCAWLIVGLVVSVPAAAQQRALVPRDYYRQTVVSEVALAPAGDAVAFTVTTVVEKENRRHREIWLATLKDGRLDGPPFRFTDPTEESSGPRWSPDGALLAFTSRRGKDPNPAWFARVKGPGGEAFHIEGVTGPPAWSPDGRWIAYVKAPQGDDAAESKDKRQGWIAPDAISRTLDAQRFDGRVVTSMRYKRDGTLELVPHVSAQPKAQLFVVSAAGGAPRSLTSGAFDATDVTWSPDSRTIVFAGDERQDDEHKVELTSDLFAVSPEGGGPRKLTTNPGSEGNPQWSPKGNSLAFLSTQARGAETDVMVVDVSADGAFQAQPRNLTANWSDGPGEPTWSSDGQTVRFVAGVRGNAHLFEVSLQGQERQVTTGDRTIAGASFTNPSRLIAYSASDPMHPPEVFVSRADGSAEQRLTGFNDALLAEVALTPAERLTWKVANGTEVEGWVHKPVGYQAGRSYPMVLKIHGGPHGAYGNVWFDQFQMLSGAGFFVLFTNPRGSTGYGHAFTYATREKWGELDREDYLGGVDAALKKYSNIDPKRVGISGGSYGGFMTAWLTATEPDRWAAAVTARTIVNWESWYGASDAQGLTEYEFGGTPWEKRALYRRLSPISYVERVKAPTLILEGEQDYRTPMAEGEQWFMALIKRKVPTELVRYPRSSHGLSRNGEPWLLVDRLERLISWFDHWLIKNPAGTRTSAPGH